MDKPESLKRLCLRAIVGSPEILQSTTAAYDIFAPDLIDLASEDGSLSFELLQCFNGSKAVSKLCLDEKRRLSEEDDKGINTHVSVEWINVALTMPSLRELSLNCTSLPDSVLELVGDLLPNLTALSVASTCFTGPAVVSLAKRLPALRSIDISQKCLDGRYCDSFCAIVPELGMLLPNLTKLVCRSNDFSVCNAELRTFLQYVPGLTYLDVSMPAEGQGAAEDPVELPACLDTLKVHGRFARVDMSACARLRVLEIAEEGYGNIDLLQVAALAHLEELSLHAIGNTDLSSLASLTALTRLELAHMLNGGNEWMEGMLALKTLALVNVGSGVTSEFHTQVLSRMRKLEAYLLDVNYDTPTIDDTALDSLDFPNLKDLMFYVSGGPSYEASSAFVGRLPALQSAVVYINQSALDALLKRPVPLQSLVLVKPRELTEEVLSLAGATHLHTLHATKVVLEDLSGLHLLRRLILNNPIDFSGCPPDFLVSLPHLEYLDLDLSIGWEHDTICLHEEACKKLAVLCLECPVAVHPMKIHHTFPNLREINVENLEGLQQVLSESTLLQAVRVTDTDDAFMAFLAQLEFLFTLKLTTERVTAEGVETLAGGAPRMRRFALYSQDLLLKWKQGRLASLHAPEAAYKYAKESWEPEALPDAFKVKVTEEVCRAVALIAAEVEEIRLTCLNPNGDIDQRKLTEEIKKATGVVRSAANGLRRKGTNVEEMARKALQASPSDFRAHVDVSLADFLEQTRSLSAIFGGRDCDFRLCNKRM